ncbi:MAG: glycosyltransferase [Acidobacteriota bacterium]
MSLKSKLSEAFKIWNRSGVAGIRARIAWNKKKSRERAAYARWLKVHGSPTGDDRAEMRRRIAGFSKLPLISVVLPVYNVDEKWLRLCLDSVLDQIYENWELCIADDCSPKPHIRRVLDEYAAGDARVKVVYRPENGHISAASNSALEIAAGEFVVLLDHDDELSPDALFWVANELNDFPGTAMIYSDEDMIDTRGRRSEPKFKPDFSRDLLYSLNLVTHLSAYKTDLIRSIRGFRLGFEGSQDYDLALRIVERIDEHQIRHIPRVLYHWRAIAGSVALSSDEKPYAHERARSAIREHLERGGISASVGATHYNLHRVKYEMPGPAPAVSIVVVVDGHMENADQLVANTRFKPIEVVLVNPKTKTVGAATNENLKTLACRDMSRAARLNLAVRESTGEIIVFLGGGVVPLTEDWLDELVRFAARTEIGAVGGRILSADETVIDGGLVLGAGTGVAVAHYGFPWNIVGNMGRNQFIGNFSAVSETCMAVKRVDFERAGGFDETNLPNDLFAADFCLKLGQFGLRIVFTPYAELIRKKMLPAADPTEAEFKYFEKRWLRHFVHDPFYNPNLSKRDGTFSIKV